MKLCPLCSHFQAQVQSLRKQITQALTLPAGSKKNGQFEPTGSTPQLREDNNDDDDEASAQQAARSRAQIAAKLEILRGLEERSVEVIAAQVAGLSIPFEVAPPCTPAIELGMISVLQRSAGESESLAHVYSATETPHGHDGFMPLSGKGVGKCLAVPPGFFAKYLRKVQPFAFNHVIDDGNGNEDAYDPVVCGAHVGTGSSVPADDEIDDELGRGYVPDEDCAENCAHATREGMCSEDPSSPVHDFHIQQEHIDDIDDFAEAETSQRKVEALSTTECRVPCPETNPLPQDRVLSFRQNKISRDQETQEFIHRLTSDKIGWSSSPDHVVESDAIVFSPLEDICSPAPLLILEKKTLETPSSAQPIIEAKQPSVPKPAKPVSKFDDSWGRFTVSDAQRYFQSLQVQRSIHSATSTKRRFRHKSAASLLVAGAPSCTGDAVALLRSEQFKRAQSQYEARNQPDAKAGRTRFLLGSLDALLARPPHEFMLSTTATLSACLSRLCPPANVGRSTSDVQPDDEIAGDDTYDNDCSNSEADQMAAAAAASTSVPGRYVVCPTNRGPASAFDLNCTCICLTSTQW